MSKFNDVHTVVVLAENANLNDHTYTEIYSGSIGCSMVVNGVSVDMGANSNISIWVKTISGGAGCLLYGVMKDVSIGNLDS